MPPIRFAALRWGRCLRLAPGLLMSSAPRVATAGDPVRAVPAGPVPAAGARAADELGAQGGHCRCWWIRFTPLRRGRCLRLAPGLLMSSMSEGDTADASDPVRGAPMGPVLAAGARAADELSAQGGHCRCWWIRFAPFRRGRCLRLALGLLMSSAPRAATAGAGGSGSRRSGGAGACGWRQGW